MYIYSRLQRPRDGGELDGLREGLGSRVSDPLQVFVSVIMLLGFVCFWAVEIRVQGLGSMPASRKKAKIGEGIPGP